MKKILFLLLQLLPVLGFGQNISFQDDIVKEICIENWDTNGDGELSLAEAASVTDLEDNFSWNSSITSFTELKYFTGLNEIGDGAFEVCSSLTSIDIPNSVTSIGYRAFMDCSGLTSIDIPNSVTSIGEWAFSICSGLTSIDIPNSVTSIGDYAFSWCSGLTSIDIPNSVTSIGEEAFSYCSSLTSIDIPNSVASIGSYAFSGCSSLPVENGIRYADTYLVEAVDTNHTTYQIKEGTRFIGSSAFSECSSLTSIDIPNSVTSIGEWAFHYCSSLTSIDIPNSMTSIGEWAFYHCSGLTSITIPNSVTSIGEGAFYDCNSLDTVIIENPVPAEIYGSAFEDQENAILYVPYGSKESYQAAEVWRDFGNIIEFHPLNDTISYAGLLYSISQLDFYSNHNEVQLIKNENAEGDIIIPSTIIDETGTEYSVTSIEEKAFYNCGKITSLSIPATVTNIGKAITSCCTNLGSITVDADNPVYDSHDNCNAVIETETGRLIAGCYKTVIPEGVTVVGSEAMRGMFGLKAITLPSTLKTIEGLAFYHCKGLKGSLRIPDGVTSVATYAFYKCTGLTSLDIPATVTSLGTYAFRECTGLTTVRCRIATPLSINSKTFANYADCTLMVPEGSVSAYKAASVWKTFKQIIGDANKVSVPEVEVYTGEQGSITVDFITGHEDEYTGYQFDVVLPEGISVVQGGYTLSDRFNGSGVTCSISKLSDTEYRVVCYSTNRKTISGIDGTLITLSVKADEDMAPATYTGQVKDFILNDQDNNSVYLDDTDFFITVVKRQPGDVNHDTAVDITDVLMTVDYILGKNPIEFYKDDGDVNRDGKVNISDVLSIVDIILGYKKYVAPPTVRTAMFDNLFLTKTNNTYMLCLDNQEPYKGCQMRVKLPDGCTLRDASLVKERSDGHQVSVRNHGDGEYTLVVYSTNGQLLRDNSTPLLRLLVNGNGNADDIQVSDILFTSQQWESVLLPDVSGISTGITETDSDESDSPIYNVQGQRVKQCSHGILISNGKKKVVK